MAGQFGDTQSDIKNLYSKVDSLERALERLVEAMHESTRQHAESLIYQRQHDKNTERTGQRLEKVETRIENNERKTNKIATIGATVVFFISGGVGFFANHAMNGMLYTNHELGRLDKEVDKIKFILQKSSDSGQLKASIKCAGDMDDCNPQPKPAPKPDVIVTNDGV